MDVIVDTTVLTNFALIKGEDILRAVFKGILFTTEEVLKELWQGEERRLFPKRDWKWLKALKIESDDERQAFKLINQRLGTGESSCLALAIYRDFKVLTDDLDARRYAQKRGLAVSGTIGILVMAVKNEIISLRGGNRFLSELIEYGYYSPYKVLDGLL